MKKIHETYRHTAFSDSYRASCRCSSALSWTFIFSHNDEFMQKTSSLFEDHALLNLSHARTIFLFFLCSIGSIRFDSLMYVVDGQ
jgi:hypothetical protein